MALEGLLANLLALPSTLDDQQAQSQQLRAVLGPQPDGTPGLFNAQQLDALAPNVSAFPGRNVPVLGHILHAVGETGQLLQSALGSSPDAPRMTAGTLVQVQQLQSQQKRKQGMLTLLGSVPQEQRELYRQLVDAGDFDNALKVGGFAKSTAKPSMTQLAEERADLRLRQKEGQLAGPQARRLAQLDDVFGQMTGMSGDRAMAGLGASYARADYSAGLSEANTQRREDRAAERKAAEDADKQRQLEEFRNQNRLDGGGAGPPAGVPTPGSGVGRISLISGGDPLDPAALGTDPLATSESSRSESPTNLSITRVTPRERLEAVKALRETGTSPENPDGSYSEAQILQYKNAVAGSGAQATALGGLTPNVIAQKAEQARQLGLNALIPKDWAVALAPQGVTPGMTLDELDTKVRAGEVNLRALQETGQQADSTKLLKRIRSARNTLKELADATSVLTTSPALAMTRLQGLGLEISRLQGDPRAAAIAAGAVVTPSIRRAMGDVGNMSQQEQQITFDAVIPSSGDTQASAQNKLIFMDKLLAVLEEEASGVSAGPGVKERVIATLEPLDPQIRQKMNAGGAGASASQDAGDGFTVEIIP